MRRGRRLVPFGSIVAALIVVASACTNETGGEQETAPTAPRPRGQEEIDSLGALSDVTGRLLVLGHEFEITLMDADGGNAILVAGQDEGVQRRTQPTWSPDGEQIAWTERRTSGQSDLVIASRAGQILGQTEVPFLAGYLAWSPTMETVAIMGNDDDGKMRLAVADPTSESDSEIFESGFPMYIDWIPDGSGLLVHVADRFDLAPLEGPRIPVETDGDFRVGVHVGDALLYGVDAGVGEVLVLRTSPVEQPRGILRYAAPAALVVAPNGDRVAILARGSRESASVVEFDDPVLSTLAPSRLEILDLESGDLTSVTEAPAVAWFWSPDGSSLLYSTSVVEGGASLIKWWIYRDGAITPFGSFTPSGEFARSYLAFFDQLDRSVSFWSPDSRAFVYAGGEPVGAVTTQPVSVQPTQDSDQRSGIWVQAVGHATPVLVADGQVAVWSPN